MGATDESMCKLSPALEQLLGYSISEKGELRLLPKTQKTIEQSQCFFPRKFPGLNRQVLL